MGGVIVQSEEEYKELFFTEETLQFLGTFYSTELKFE